MTNQTIIKPSIWFWIISVVALIWNGMGVNQYIQQAYKTEGFMAMYDEEQLALIEQTPSWAIAAFAIAVFGGLLGSLALLLKKKLANTLFLLSLFAIIVQMTYNFFIIDAMEVFGPGAIYMPIMVILFAVFLIWFSKKGITKGWLS